MFKEFTQPNLTGPKQDNKSTYNHIEATYREKSNEIPKNINLSLFMALGGKWLQLGGDDNYKPPENLNVSSEGTPDTKTDEPKKVKEYQKVVGFNINKNKWQKSDFPNKRAKIESESEIEKLERQKTT